MELMRFLGLLFFGLGVFGFAYYYSQKGLDWFQLQSTGTRDYIVRKLSMMFIELPPEKITIYMFAYSFGMGGITFLFFIPQLLPAILFAVLTGVAAWWSLRPIVDYMYRRRLNKFVLQMVDALSLMSNGLKSGLSVVQALSLVVEEMPNPIQQEFNLILSQNKLGVSIEEAFSNLAQRLPAEDVEMFVTAVNILKETGGNLSETFDTIVVTIRERIKVESKISALTAQGFYQGMIIMAVPPALGFMLQQTDPDFISPLFNTPIGWVILSTILVLEVVGFFVIMKVVKIDV